MVLRLDGNGANDEIYDGDDGGGGEYDDEVSWKPVTLFHSLSFFYILLL